MTSTSRKDSLMMLGGLAVLLILLAADLLAGQTKVSLFHPDGAQALVLWQYRLPRAVTAILAGASLALAGMQMQAVFRNPLADPHVMGVSSGASLAAAAVTAFVPAAAAGTLSLAAAAFAGAFAAALIIVLVSSRVHGASALLIFGVMLGYVLSACTSIIEYSSSDRALRVFYNWSAGSFSATTWSRIVLMAILSLLGTLIAVINLRGLDSLLFGDAYARSTGVSVGGVRVLALLSCCVLTGAVTAFCGPLGFVGIVSPHIARRVWGSGVHRRIVLPVMITGAVISLLADLLSLAFRMPVPVGSAMAVVGIPVILYILLCLNRFQS